MSHANSSMEDINNSKNIQKDNNIGILSLMECFDKQSKADDIDKTNINFNNQSFETQSISQNNFNEKKSNLNQKKMQQDANLQLLRNEFEDDLKKQNDKISVKTNKQNDFKKLLDDIKVVKKDKEKKLIIEYSTLIKLTENDTSISTDTSLLKSRINQSSFIKNSQHSISGVKQFDKSRFLNQSSQMSQANSFTNTEENLLNLQSQIVMIQQKQEEVVNKQLLEENKQNALHNMKKELEKSKNMLKQEINNYQEIIESYNIQVKQAEEKQLKFDQEYARRQVDLNRIQETILMGEQQNNKELDILNDGIQLTKEQLNQAVQEYRQLQTQIEKASEEHDETLLKIEEENQQLKEKYLKMIDSRQLMKEIDDFDILTKTFIYDEPDEEQVQTIQNNLKYQQEKEQQRILQHQKLEQISLQQGKAILSLEEQDLMDLMDNRQKNGGKTDQIPQYKQGTILQKFKKFIKDHKGDLDEVINLILQKHEEYDMEFQTLGRRIEDLQEEKRVLTLEFQKLEEQTKYLVKVEPNLESDSINSQKQNSENLQKKDQQNNKDQNSRVDAGNILEQEQQNKKQELKLINSQLFQYQQYLFLNEIIFRFSIMGGLIKSISNSNEEVKKDQYIQANLFDNEFYENLQSMLKFAASNKGQSQQQQNQQQLTSTQNYNSSNNFLNSAYRQQDSLISGQGNDSMLVSQKSNKFFQQNQTEKSLKPTETLPYLNVQKIQDFKKLFLINFPQLEEHIDQLQSIIHNDFILQYFCQIDDIQIACDRIIQTMNNQNVNSIEEQIQIIQEDFYINLKSEGISKFNNVLKTGLEFVQSYLSNLQFNKNNLYKILKKRAPESPVFKPSHVRQRIEAQKKQNQQHILQLNKKKDWKEKVIKNKIEQYQQFTDYKEFEIEKKRQEVYEMQMNQTNYTSQTQTQDKFHISDMRSSSNFNKNDASMQQFNAQEDKYLEDIRNKEKNYLIEQKEKQEKMIKEIEQRDFIEQQKKPKVISRYQQNSKYDLKYQEEWSFLVNQKKQFHKIAAEQEKQKLLQEKKKLKEIVKLGGTQSQNTIKTEILYTKYKNKLMSEQKSNPNYNNSIHGSKTLMNRHISAGKIRNERSSTGYNNRSINQNFLDRSISKQDSVQSTLSKKFIQNSTNIKKGTRSISTVENSNNKHSIQTQKFKLQPIYTNSNKKLTNAEKIQLNSSMNKNNSKNYGLLSSDNKSNKYD